MGGLWSVQIPVPDERMIQTIVKLKLQEHDLEGLYRKFTKIDKEVRAHMQLSILKDLKTDCCLLYKSGSIDRVEFFKSIDEKMSELGDAIFSLIDEDNSGQLDFSEYVEALGKFCILTKEDMLKFCFNIFDADRNGTIEGEELNHLMEILHEDSQTSNMALAMKTFDFNDDGKIDFVEFKQLNHMFPALLYPAFRIQQNMRIFTMGEKWWTLKIEQLIQEKEDELAKAKAATSKSNTTGPKGSESQEEKDRKAAEAKRRRQDQGVRIKMGCLKYYLCPCRRHRYIVDETQQKNTHSDSDSDSEEEMEKKRKKAQAEALKAKNQKKKTTAAGKKNGNIVKVGPRKALTQEERLERAKKRRMRDMQDRPLRKD